jgi:FMN phosphatase YigB (HAD superfamily)
VKPAPPACRAILLDFGGTLDADGVTWKERMRALYRAAGLDVTGTRFDGAFYAADDALVGAIPRELDLASTVHRLVAGVHRGLGLAPDDTAEAIGCRFTEDTLARARSRAPLLGALGAHRPLAVVANFYGNLDAVCAEASIRPYFAAVIDSEVAGSSKPDPRIFQTALRALGVPPGEALFVGDSLPRDMAGARAVGMPHVWLAADAASGGPCCAGDPVIRALDELAELLR